MSCAETGESRQLGDWGERTRGEDELSSGEEQGSGVGAGEGEEKDSLPCSWRESISTKKLSCESGRRTSQWRLEEWRGRVTSVEESRTSDML